MSSASASAPVPVPASSETTAAAAECVRENQKVENILKKPRRTRLKAQTLVRDLK